MKSKSKKKTKKIVGLLLCLKIKKIGEKMTYPLTKDSSTSSNTFSTCIQKISLPKSFSEENEKSLTIFEMIFNQSTCREPICKKLNYKTIFHLSLSNKEPFPM